MFANFIYLIIALLLYSTYQPSDTHNFGPIETLLLFLGSTLLFAYANWNQFNRLAMQASRDNYSQLDHSFNRLLTRYSILAAWERVSGPDDAASLTGRRALVYFAPIPALWALTRAGTLFVIPQYKVLSAQQRI